jgi:hypothetical protein
MFNFGNKKPDIKQYAIIGIVLSSIIAILSQCTGVSENGLWDLFDEIQRKYFPQTILNEFIIKDPEKLNRRIIRDVDRAIQNITPEYDRIIEEADKKYQPQYTEKEIDQSICYTDECKALGGEIRLCSPFVEGINCPLSDLTKKDGLEY